MADIESLLNQKAQENAEDRGAEKWEPEAGDTLDGILTKTGWYDGGEYAPSLWLLVKQLDSDETVRVYCPTVLFNQVTEAMPAIGSGIAIRYEGRNEAKSGRKYHAYTFVLVPDAEGNVKQDPKYWQSASVYTPPVSGASATTQNAEDDGAFF